MIICVTRIVSFRSDQFLNIKLHVINFLYVYVVQIGMYNGNNIE